MPGSKGDSGTNVHGPPGVKGFAGTSLICFIYYCNIILKLSNGYQYQPVHTPVLMSGYDACLYYVCLQVPQVSPS